MISLNTLQEMGALSKKLNIVNEKSVTSSVITHSEIKQTDEEFQSTCEKAVVVDNYQWLAVNDGESLETADIIYSSDGRQYVGSYNRSKRVFFQKELRDNKLYTVAQIKISKKENKTMPDLNNVNLENLDSLVGGTNVGDVKPMNSFSGAAGASSKELSKSKQEILALKEKIDAQDVTLANRDDIIVMNQRYGRLIGFVCRTDKGIKVSKQNVKKLDGQGNAIPKADLTPDKAAKFEELKKEKKPIPNSYCEQEKALVFREAKPSAPVAAIIAIPKGGNVDFTKLYTSQNLEAGSDTTLEYKIVSMEMFYKVIAGLFDLRIKESEDVMGNRATWLQEKISKAAAKNNGVQESLGVRFSIALADRKSRSTVLTTGNYIPLRKYVTMSQSEIKSADDAAKLQLNIEAAFKNGGYNELRDADKKIITENGLSSDYFKQSGSKPITGVTKFDDKTAEVAEVRIPVREKKQSKNDPNKYTFGYLYTDLKDSQPDATTSAILKAANLTLDQFMEKTTAVTKRQSASKKPTIEITSADLLKAMSSNSINSGTLSARDIASSLREFQA